MLSDITFKHVARTQIAMYDKLRELARAHQPCVIMPLAVGICVVDVFLDTVKYPIMAIENIVFAIINTVGSIFNKEYSLSDAQQNLKNVSTLSFVATPTMTLQSIPKFLSHLSVTLSDPKNARPSNKEAYKEAYLRMIVYSRA